MRLIEEPFLKPDQKYIDLTIKSSQLIRSICDQLGLNLDSFYFSCWIFHCNTIIQSFHHVDRYLTVCASIILGMKIGQCLKRIQDVVVVWRKHVRRLNKKQPEIDGEEALKKIKHKVLEAQVNLMMTFSFDLDIKLASQYLKHIQQNMEDNLRKQARKAVTSFYETELIIYYPPHQIALAAVLIAHKNTNIAIQTGHKQWFKSFDEQTTLQQIQDLVTTIYEYRNIAQ